MNTILAVMVLSVIAMWVVVRLIWEAGGAWVLQLGVGFVAMALGALGLFLVLLGLHAAELDSAVHAYTLLGVV
ncbi:MAG: hypothetical protein V7756_08290 [Halopseudomonas sp.]|uniref:hypothetical protein n=1 Tax=Halopseudomonas sp. TaxID=2901191 RepID=UPI003001F544